MHLGANSISVFDLGQLPLLELGSSAFGSLTGLLTITKTYAYLASILMDSIGRFLLREPVCLQAILEVFTSRRAVAIGSNLFTSMLDELP